MPPAARSSPSRLALIATALLLVFSLPLSGQAPQPPSPDAPARQASPQAEPPANDASWWVWPLVLFAFCFCLGIISVMAGIGGGVLYVPLVAAFFPFHIDFVRGTSLLMALAGALAAGPGLLRHGLARLRLALPCALLASIGAFAGSVVGLRLPAHVVQVALGFSMLLVTALILFARNVEFPHVPGPDPLSRFLRIGGSYHERSMDRDVQWHAHRTPLGLVLFFPVGFMAGMFGLGAGWANVPVLNLVMGAPLKVAVGTSVFMLSITDTTAAWVYLNRGCWLPLVAIPSILGLMAGTSLGVKVLGRSRPRVVRYLVVCLMFFAAVASLLKGFGAWK